MNEPQTDNNKLFIDWRRETFRAISRRRLTLRTAGGAVTWQRDGGGARALWGAEHAGWSDGTAGVVGENQAGHVAESAGRDQLGPPLVGEALVKGRPALSPVVVLGWGSAGEAVGGQPDTGERPRQQ